jgi:hypothetical protein
VPGHFGYEGGLEVTGPTSTELGFRHPDVPCRAETKLSGSVTLTRSNSWQGPASVVTSFQ